MPKIPCSVRITCPTTINGIDPQSGLEVDTPFLNISSEDPDVPVFLKQKFTFPPNEYSNIWGSQGCVSVCWSDTSQEEADACAQAQSAFCFITPTLCDNPPCKPPLPVGWWNEAQTCKLPCPGNPDLYVTHTVPAERFFSEESLEDANDQARDEACKTALAKCTDPEFEPFTNSEQYCSYDCEDGTTKTFITPAGFFEAVDQITANAVAYQWACVMAKSFCDGNDQWYYNTPQSCTAKCADGYSFTFEVGGGAFGALSQAAADAAALAYACGQAAKSRICMTSVELRICVEQVYTVLIEVAGGVMPITWEISEGTLPVGFSLVTNPANTRQAAFTGSGVNAGDYTFKIKATGDNDFYVEKEFTFSLVEISNAATLPQAEKDAAYNVTLTTTGTPKAPVSWQVVDGELPPGLLLNEETGEISGTPTTNGTYNFTILLQDEAT